MCVRFIPSAAEEAQAVLDARGTGRHGIRFVEHPDSIHDAHPGSTVSLFVPDGAGGLKVARLEWGSPLDGKPHAVFNTRIESAREQLRRGRRGMSAKVIAEAAASSRRAPSARATPPRGSQARGPGSPSVASTASASPAPARSSSQRSSRTVASPSSPRSPMRASHPSTTACRSSSGLANRVYGSA